jgi:hypothetical protein
MDKNNIKNLLNQTFISEASVPGLDIVKKVNGENGKENKKAIKDMEKDLSNYDKATKKTSKDNIKPVKFNYTDNSEEEYHQEMEIMNGQEMIQYDRTPSEEYSKRAEEAIEGSSRMGNNPEWANVVAAGQGGDPEFGKNLVKAIKASAKKRSDATPTTKMFGDDWEITKEKSHKAYAMENKVNNKETIKESNKMKKLTFRKPFNGINNALSLIPETYKVDNKTFVITDGNESYKVRWEGSLNEGKGVVLVASDKTLVNEDISKMRHLMGYKSEDSLGTLKGSERLSEDKKFSDIWNKTKTILSEGFGNLENELTGVPPYTGPEDPMENQVAEESPVSTGDIKQDMLSSINGINKMGNAEKGSLNTTMNAITDYLSNNGNQLKGSVKIALDRLMTAINSEAPQAQPEIGMGESEITHAPMDRFEEVFDLEPEEDYSVDDRSVEYGINPYQEQPNHEDLDNESRYGF